MSEITVIGLGLMGAALAQTLHQAGRDVTVWNRSPAKMQPFIDDGIATAPDLAAAVTASPVILVCIDNYDVTKALLGSVEAAPLLAGRTLIQLSTGTPREARAAATWAHAQDAAYLDGAILAGPGNIGTDTSIILLAGDQPAHDRAGPLLECLGGTVRYLGVNVGAASVLDLAWLCTSYGRFLAVAHAARLCESEGVGLDAFASLFEKGSMVHHDATVIHTAAFDHCTATLQVWGAALKQIQRQGQDAGINTDFPDQLAGLFEKAVDAGHGEEHVMALVKVLRTADQRTLRRTTAER